VIDELSEEESEEEEDEVESDGVSLARCIAFRLTSNQELIRSLAVTTKPSSPSPSPYLYVDRHCLQFASV
jgi:hypothetical protein